MAVGSRMDSREILRAFFASGKGDLGLFGRKVGTLVAFVTCWQETFDHVAFIRVASIPKAFVPRSFSHEAFALVASAHEASMASILVASALMAFVHVAYDHVHATSIPKAFTVLEASEAYTTHNLAASASDAFLVDIALGEDASSGLAQGGHIMEGSHVVVV